MMTNVLTIASLIVCHNRREKTLRAIATLEAAAPPSVQLETVLFDDGSTDGTAEAVKTMFPRVRLVHGSGNAFWNRGLYEAWRRALELSVDAFLWLNDDVELDADAFTRLLNAWETLAAERSDKRFILVGSTRGLDESITYGGYRIEPSPFALRFRLVQTGNEPEPIDTFNGNIVFVPREVVMELGINDPEYFHNFGDNDYGLRASRSGIAVRLLPGTLGVCESNYEKRLRGYGSPELRLSEQWAKVNTHHGLPFRGWWRFTRRHSGRWWLLHFLIPYRWLVIPRWLRSSRRRNHHLPRRIASP
jgi:GT2 family glycosyltransferase